MTASQHPFNGAWMRALAVLVSVAMASSVVFAVADAAPAQAAPGDPIIYGASGFGTANVMELDIAAQTSTDVGDLARESAAIDLDPATGRLYFYEWQNTGNEFGYFDPALGVSTIVRTYTPNPGHTMMRMAFDPAGLLYAMDEDDSLYTIDPTTGDLSDLGVVNGLNGVLTTGTGDMSFADDGTLYVAVDRNLYTVDLGSLSSTLQFSGMIPVSGVGFTVWTGLTHCNGVMYASNVEQLSSGSGIFTIDPATGDEELLFYAPSRLNDLASCSQVQPPVNTAPVATDDSVTTPNNQPVQVTLAATDVDGDPLTYQVITAPTNGSLTGTAPNLTYTPNAGHTGTDTLTFIANDSQVDSNTATITITTNPAANSAPVAVDDTAITGPDQPVALTLTASDVDGDPLTYQVITAPTNGSLTGTAPNLTYTPNAGHTGTDTLTFIANDSQTDSNTATITITTNPPAVTVPGSPTALVTVEGDSSVSLSWQTPTDDGGSPITDYTVELSRRGESWTTAADGVSSSTTATITGLTNYDEYRFRVAAVNTSGSSNPTSEVWSTPTNGDDPDDSFNHANSNLSDRPNWVSMDPGVLAEVQIIDGYLSGSEDPDGTATTFAAPVGPDIEVTIDALLGDDYNEASVVLRMPTQNDYDTSYLLQWVTDGDYVPVGTVIGPALQIWRLDPGQFTLLADAQLPNNGERTLTFGAHGANIYIAENNTVLLSAIDDTYLTGDYFALGQADFSGTGAATRLDNLRFETLDPPPNTAPVAVDDSVTTPNNQPVQVTLAATDVDGDPLTYQVITAPTNGSLTGTAPNLTYTPNAGHTGTDTLTFIANDSQVDSNTATITITTNPAANSAPVAVDDTAITGPDQPVALTLTASDVDGDPLTYTVTTNPTNGSLTGTAPNLTYTPNAEHTGTDTLTFIANDTQTDSNTATITITTNPPANSAPVATDDSVTTPNNQPVQVTLAATDVDGDPLTYTVTTNPTNGSLTGTAPNLTYTPNAGHSGTDTLTFIANDSQVDSNTATITITTNPPPNTAPVATDDSVSTPNNQPVQVTLAATDVDGDPLTYTVTTNPTNGSLTGTAPNLTYTPNAGHTGTDTFTFIANDSQVDSNTATITITVDPPTPVLTTWGADRAGQIRSIDLIEGTSTSAPALSFGTQAMDRDPATGEVYYFKWGPDGNELASWDPSTGTNTSIRTYNPAPGIFVVQMAFAPDGTLYIIDIAGALHSIDPASGDISTLGSITGLVSGPHGQVGDLAFAPDGTAYLATYGDLYQLDLTTRVATIVHSDMFNGAGFLWLGLAHCDGKLFGSHIDGANRSAIYEIDIASGAITRLHYIPGYVADLTSCAIS